MHDSPGQVETKDVNYSFLLNYLGLFAAIPTARETQVWLQHVYLPEFWLQCCFRLHCRASRWSTRLCQNMQPRRRWRTQGPNYHDHRILVCCKWQSWVDSCRSGQVLKEASTERWGPIFTGGAAKTPLPGWANLNYDPGLACHDHMRHVCQEGA